MFLNHTTIKVDTWETARQTQLLMCKATRWAFRGQRDAAWKLKTNFERQVENFGSRLFSKDPRYCYKREKHILDEFKRRAHFYDISLPTDDNWVEWLSLLQHYGGPTRFLDFTDSFYVGFAEKVRLEEPETK